MQSSVQEWLRYLNLEEYLDSLSAEGYVNMEALMDIAWEDLEDIGVHKLGIVLAILSHHLLVSFFSVAKPSVRSADAFQNVEYVTKGLLYFCRQDQLDVLLFTMRNSSDVRRPLFLYNWFTNDSWISL